MAVNGRPLQERSLESVLYGGTQSSGLVNRAVNAPITSLCADWMLNSWICNTDLVPAYRWLTGRQRFLFAYHWFCHHMGSGLFAFLAFVCICHVIISQWCSLSHRLLLFWWIESGRLINWLRERRCNHPLYLVMTHEVTIILVEILHCGHIWPRWFA